MFKLDTLSSIWHDGVGYFRKCGFKVMLGRGRGVEFSINFQDLCHFEVISDIFQGIGIFAL